MLLHKYFERAENLKTNILLTLLEDSFNVTRMNILLEFVNNLKEKIARTFCIHSLLAVSHVDCKTPIAVIPV